MSQRTGSISKGKAAPAHNLRHYKGNDWPDNVDRLRTQRNVVLVNRDLHEVYREVFGAALDDYNAKQTRKDRRIPDYLEHIQNDKQRKPVYEFVIAVGSRDSHESDEVSVEVYREWLERFQAAYGDHFIAVQAVVHLDEATPHMHVEVVPVATGYKRGLAVQNSFQKAIEQCGFVNERGADGGPGREGRAFQKWILAIDDILTQVMAEHGIERVAGDKSTQAGRVGIHAYKEVVRSREEAAQAVRTAHEADREAYEAIKVIEASKGAIEERDRARRDLDVMIDHAAKIEAEVRGLQEKAALLHSEVDQGLKALSLVEGAEVVDDGGAALARHHEDGSVTYTIPAEYVSAVAEAVIREGDRLNEERRRKSKKRRGEELQGEFHGNTVPTKSSSSQSNQAPAPSRPAPSRSIGR